MKAKRELLASQIALKRRLTNEERLQRELSKFFKKLHKEVQSALQEYWSEYQMLQGHINLICAPVHEAHKEYYEILKKYKLKEYELGKREAKRLVDRAGVRYAFKEVKSMPINGFIKKNSNELFGTLPKAEQDLLNRTFKTSERTLSRVDDQLNNIITDGYRSGKGINDISNQITRRFDQLESWEAKRIARTEVNTAHNKATIDTYNEMGVEYTQWIAASDDRTRDSHVEVDGEIIPLGGTYSNGLQYPGDMSGPIEEWINCRCSNAPFVIPYGYIAPSFSPFREEDLIPIENVKSADEILQPTEPSIQVPTDEQLKTHLTKAELDEVKWAKSVLSKDFHTEMMKQKAQSTLDELYSKALNKKPIPKPEKVPKQEVKVEPLKPKTKTVEEQPVKPKPVSAETKVNRMSSQELYDSMTKADKKRYDKIKTALENTERNIKLIGDNPALQQIKQKQLKDLEKLEQKQKDKLFKKHNKDQPKTKTERDLVYEGLKKSNEPVWQSHKSESVLSSKSINKLEKWANKRVEGNIEWGYRFNTKTGELMGREFKGGRSGVTLKGDNPNVGSIHIHTNELSPWPSAGDIKSYRCDSSSEHYIMSKHEIWYVHAEEHMGVMGKLAQMDIDRIYEKCIKESNEYLKQQMIDGKLKPNESSIKTASDIDIGNRLIKEFSKKEWKEKGLIVKRYLR